MNKIAIVGSNSNVGKCLSSFLEEKKDIPIIKIARQNADVNVDLNDRLCTINFPENIDTVVIVASAFTQNNEEEIINMVETNEIGPLKICMAAKQARIKRIVYISSVSAKIMHNNPYYNFYSISKKNCELILKHYCHVNNIDLCIIRPSQIYGTDFAFANHQPLFYSILESVKKEKDVVIYGNHDPIRNFIHVEDVVDTIYRAVIHNASGEFDVVGENVKISTIFNIAAKCINSKSKLTFDDSKNDLIDNPFFIDEKIEKVLFKNTYVSLENGVKRIYEKLR